MRAVSRLLACLFAAVCIWNSTVAPAAAQDAPAPATGATTAPGRAVVGDSEVGTVIDLTQGQWLFKPGYALAEDEKPETLEADAKTEGYLPVPVPQMLSRIQWWLDDSEDFKRWEQARLDALGVDPEKIEDGWYRLAFDVPRDWPKGRNLWVEFDGVAMQCRTFCNGQKVGEHKGMFSRFAYDLTPYVKPGETNVLSVWVSMEKIPPTEGNLGEAVTVNLSAAKVVSMSKGMFGPLTPNQDNRAYDLVGIWQPVRLVVRGPYRIEDAFFNPSLTGASVRVEVGPFTKERRGGDFRVTATLTDIKTGEQFARESKDFHAESKVDIATLQFINLKPTHWTPANPYLYRLDVELSRGDDVLDRWTHDVGFRTFEVRGNQFYLNGRPYWLRGSNQLPYGKNPWDPELPRHLIRLMHDANQRFTRTHCTPWNEAWLKAADEIGIAVSIEGIRPWAFAGRSDQIGREVMPPPEIVEHWMMENADVVRRCRNHPSVVLFTVGNEMLLRDKENLKKWQILSDVAKQTKQLASSHPVVISSDYVRDEKFYASTLQPANLYDGDVDDMHQYRGWYSDSPFFADTSSFKKTGRPLIGQEMSSGYPDLDTGLPVLRYTRDLLTPQAWVGVYAYPGNDPAIFLNEHAKVTKRWAEQLRFERADKTAGFSLFSAECWFRHSYLPEATPYPVVEAVKHAFAPVGLALETNQRRFYHGGMIETGVFVTNDDEDGRDLRDLSVRLALTSPDGKETYATGEPSPLGDLSYYGTTKVAAKLRLPKFDVPRRPALLVTRLLSEGNEVSRTVDPVELFQLPRNVEVHPDPKQNVVVKPGESLDGLKVGGELRKKIEGGMTAVVFSPSKEIVSLFPDDLLDVRGSVEKPDFGEFADWYPARGTRLVENLQPMDLKWWAREGDWCAYVAPTSHRLKPGGRARELIRFIPAHSYIPTEKVGEQYRCVMSEIPLGQGRLWICDLDVEASYGTDPAARLFADNLYAAAADPNSTKDLQPVPSHEELLKNATPLDASGAAPARPKRELPPELRNAAP